MHCPVIAVPCEFHTVAFVQTRSSWNAEINPEWLRRTDDELIHLGTTNDECYSSGLSAAILHPQDNRRRHPGKAR